MLLNDSFTRLDITYYRWLSELLSSREMLIRLKNIKFDLVIKDGVTEDILYTSINQVEARIKVLLTKGCHFD